MRRKSSACARIRIVPGDSHEFSETLADRFRAAAQFLGFRGGKVGATVTLPQAEPRGKMLFLQTEWHVFEGHGSAVQQRSAGHSGPEIGNLLKMGRPVFDVGGKDRADFVMLADIGVKVTQELHQRLTATDSFIE